MLAPSTARCVACKGMLEARALYCGVCGRRTRLRSDSRTGAVVGGTYRIDGKLAEGGFGAVYRATHVPSGLELALKLLHADFCVDPRIAARFRRESRALANLRDRHTVMTFERGEFRDGTLFIAMELLRGETLLDRLRSAGRLPWRSALAIVRAICSSLGEAHAYGIVHRDLKPANIHLGADDFVKVLDFGIARIEPETTFDDGTELTLAGETLGTLQYMAPEQIAGVPCTSRSDIYALGVVAFEMICGRRPFPDATTPATLATALFTQSPPVPSTLVAAPDSVDHIVLRCLERDPAHRFASVVDLAAAIDRTLIPPPPARVAQVHEVVIPEVSLVARGSVVDVPPLRASRRIVYVLGALIGAAAAGIAWTLAA